MLSDKLINDKTRSSLHDDTYEPRSCECTPLDQTFALGLVLVMAIIATTLYFALYYRPY